MSEQECAAGRCCDCGDDGDSPDMDVAGGFCASRPDGTHCNHWWDGDDGDGTGQVPREGEA